MFSLYLILLLPTVLLAYREFISFLSHPDLLLLFLDIWLLLDRPPCNCSGPDDRLAPRDLIVGMVLLLHTYPTIVDS